MKTKEPRRNRFEIVGDILRIARTGAKKSHIVYKANLNFTIAEGYLNKMIERGLIATTDESGNVVYRTTPAGKDCLEKLGSLQIYF